MNVAENDRKHGYSENVSHISGWVSFFMDDHALDFYMSSTTPPKTRNTTRYAKAKN